MNKRYEVTPPVDGGYAWWNVIDKESHKYWGQDNFAVATVFKGVPDAEAAARQICERLNQSAEATVPAPQVDLEFVAKVAIMRFCKSQGIHIGDMAIRQVASEAVSDLRQVSEELCQECGKPLTDEAHTRYGVDFGNIRKHIFISKRDATDLAKLSGKVIQSAAAPAEAEKQMKGDK